MSPELAAAVAAIALATARELLAWLDSRRRRRGEVRTRETDSSTSHSEKSAH